MAWAIITIYISKCAQMNPNSYLKGQNSIPNAKSVTSKNLRGWVPPPIGSPKVNSEPAALKQEDQQNERSVLQILYREQVPA